MSFETLEDRALLAGTHIQIEAAGTTGSESMQLLINGVAVANWANVAGSTSTGAFDTFVYDHPTTVPITQVRVAFTNDANTAAGDRNLMVNSVTLDALRYDARASNVWSTGTWMPTIGVTAGYKQSPWLHVNGYLQFGAKGSTVDVLAAGTTKTEQIALQVNGATVATYNITAGDYAGGTSYQKFTYTTTAALADSQLRVAFVNDGLTPAGADRNVRIDGVVLNGVKLESERQGVLNTGNLVAGQGAIPQLMQTDKLFVNGYFQYGDNGTQVIVRAAGSYGDETMQLRTGNQNLATFRHVAGNASTGQFREFRYRASTTLAIATMSVALTNDYNSAIDRNLRVDSLSLGGVVYQAEGADVYSTGTYVATVGIKPGYWRTEFLHANGAFFFSRPGTPGTLALGTSLFSVNEAAGIISIPVVRTGGSDGTVAIQYTTVDATATAGSDYTKQTGTLVFAPGETQKSIVVPIINDALDDDNETFNVAADLVLGSAVLGQPRTATVTIIDDDGTPPPGNGNGLLGAYYNGTFENTLMFERTDATVNFDWALGSPGPGVNVDNFSVAWTGKIEPRYTQQYTFRTSTDDGVNLWVNGVQLVAQYHDQGLASYTGSINLVAGQKYDIRMESYDKTGYAAAKLEWSSPSTPWEVVPKSQLSSPAPTVVVPGTFAGQTIATGLSNPTAMDFDASGRIFVAEQRGVVRVVQNGQLIATPFLDIQSQVNFIQDRGLIGIAVHPNFPAVPFVYVSYVWDPPQTASFSGLAGRDGGGNRLSRVSRFTADAASGYNVAVPGSEVVLVGGAGTWSTISHPEIDSTADLNNPPTGGPNGDARDVLIIDSLTHAVGNLQFAPDGTLLIANGDGASYGRVDPRALRVQNLDSLSGKLLRVDPFTGQGVANNPFYNGDPNANRSKVVNYGLRNPFRFTIHPGTGLIYNGDVGWNTHEEINLGWGQNFGWPYYEGVAGQSAPTGGYNALPTAAAFYANNNANPPIWSRAHADGGVAIVVGDFYTGTVYPAQYQGSLFFTDYGDPQLKYMRVASNGLPVSVAPLNLNAGVVVEMSMGRDGFMYYVDITGKIGRLTFTPFAAAAALTAPAPSGDVNGDAAVNGSDFLAWQRAAHDIDPSTAAEQLAALRTEFGRGPATTVDSRIAWVATASPVVTTTSSSIAAAASVPRGWTPSQVAVISSELRQPSVASRAAVVSVPAREAAVDEALEQFGVSDDDLLATLLSL